MNIGCSLVSKLLLLLLYHAYGVEMTFRYHPVGEASRGGGCSFAVIISGQPSVRVGNIH